MIREEIAQTKPTSARLLTLDHVWLAAALSLIALRVLLTPIKPNDVWWHLATGRTIVDAGYIPQTDAWSFTRFGEPFFNQSWLAQVLMYGIHQLGGPSMLVLVQTLVIALAYALLLRLCILRSGRVNLSVALLLATLPVVFDNWTIRPQSYVFPIFVGFLTVLTEYRLGHSRRLWLLPPLMALWVNMHGSFVLGLVMISITFFGIAIENLRNRELGTENRRPFAGSRFSVLGSLVVWGILTALATLLNPRGIAVLGYVRNLLSSNQVTTLVSEWMPPTVQDTAGKLFFLFVILFGVVLIYARRRPNLIDMLLCGALLWLALGAGRNVIWFGFAATPVLAAQASTFFGPARARNTTGSAVLNGVFVGLLALMVFAALPWFKTTLFPPSVGAVLAPETPIDAVRFLETMRDRPKHLFHSEATGSYLIWAAPEQPVFIDTRIELYPYQQWRDYINLSQGNDVGALIDKYALDGLLLETEHQSPLIEQIRRDSGWIERYHDDQTVLFTRQ